MWIVNLILAVLFFIIGLFFMKGKGAFLIAGYNTSSKDQKAKYDELALCKFMSKLMFVFTVSFLIIATMDLFKSPIPLFIGMSLFFGSCIFALIYANTNQRFYKK